MLNKNRVGDTRVKAHSNHVLCNDGRRKVCGIKSCDSWWVSYFCDEEISWPYFT